MNIKKEYKVNELFFHDENPYANMVTGHYKNEDGVYITYLWLFRYWRDKLPQNSYFHAYVNYDELHSVVEQKDLDKFKEDIKRTFTIDVLLS